MKPDNFSRLRQIEVKLSNVNKHIGKIISSLSLLMMSIAFLIVLMRYLFNIGSIAMQELVIYLHAMVFLSVAGYALQADRHVRVDIFYRNLSPIGKAWINLIGTSLLLSPCMFFILWSSWDYILLSWQIKEQSGDAGGLPFVYLLKSMIIVMVLLLVIQAIADIIKSTRTIREGKA